MIALADVNAFYAHCERVFRPDLAGRAIVVLSNNDGCVIARNAQAKSAGIAMGTPFFQIRAQVKRHNIAVFSSNYELYADMSQRVMRILDTFSPDVEMYSIDEAFLDFRGMNESQLMVQATSMLQQVQQCTGLQIGVGVGRTKTLAKIANFAAKKYPATGGIVVISDVQRERKLLSLVPVEDVWGVGRKLAQHFQSLSIKTALDLANCNPVQMRKSFNVVVERTVRELRGENCIELSTFPALKQQIICSRSFGKKVTKFEDVSAALSMYAEQATARLRAQKSVCQHVSIFVKTSALSASNYSRMLSMKLPSPTADTRDILRGVNALIVQIWQPNHHYTKAGVMLNELSGESQQYELFSASNRRNSDVLMATIDALNAKGSPVWFAGQGIRAKQAWAMKRRMLSPSYTTKWADLPKAMIK